MLLFPRRHATLAIAHLVSASLFTSGCGSGGTVIIDKGDPNLRYTPPGSYQYQVTATDTTGVPLSQPSPSTSRSPHSSSLERTA
ncbi:hypothetical protein [Edaphobacter modestus]|uniref:Uncharacterized protein n=1 Tax=Edaphobacter modestus TaxID=388466 RepID=A0A4Q7Z0P5_9BACT|nr:hypothetical protein [Edaphobacter modestus]RZU43404.1 hypothetical protein BDD14_5063 [Edaphobacter modestus]